MLFHDFKLDTRLQPNLEKIGFVRPTPIQIAAIPSALEGRDVVGSAETGTGKTAAFLLPILTQLLATRRTRNPRALILVPTRELALQVAEDAMVLAEGIPLRVLTVYGGAGMRPQIDSLRRGVDIVVATPGRLLDLLNRRHVSLHEIETLVLDEADRMLDIGFLPDIRRIARELPRERQTLLFTATIEPVYQLVGELTRDPIRVEVKKSVTPTGIQQSFYPVMEHRKFAVLEHLLLEKGLSSVLVFVRTRNRADLLARNLHRAGVDCGVIHGRRSQGQREQALEAFKKGRSRVLVATDVAARGIDVTGISHVVNYDMPNQAEDYVHRIGRTGRADAAGEAWSLVTPQDELMVERIQRMVKSDIQRCGIEGFDAGRPSEPIRKKPSNTAASNVRAPSRRRFRR